MDAGVPTSGRARYGWGVPPGREGDDEAREEDRLRTFYDARVEEHDRSHPGYREAWNELLPVVLMHGGRLVVPPASPEPLVDVLRTQGRIWRGQVLRRPGQRSDCHRNAVRLWREGEAVALGTGYALSADGLWREHSWGVGREGELLETTEPRASYFGVEFRGDGAHWFAEWVDAESNQ